MARLDLLREPLLTYVRAVSRITPGKNQAFTLVKEASMGTSIPSRLRGIFSRVTQTWAELDYAQRRLLEIRTGIPNLTPPKRPRISRSVSELEALYAFEEPAVDGRRLDGWAT
jgi:hypothetical protein